MKKIIESSKPILKIVGIVLILFVLWSIFSAITGTKKLGTGNLKYSAPLGSMADESRVSGLEMRVGQEGAMEITSNTSMADTSAELPSTDKKVIKNGDLTLKVENTEKSAEKISEIVKAKNGEVFSTNFYERVKGQKSGSITVKVPVGKFEETLTEIKKVATQVVSESTTGQDVTEQYSDLQAQLKNKKAEEQSFVKILDRAGEIDDVLAVTRQIARVRGEIERLEGRIRFMDSQTDMSTITVSLSEDIEIAPVQNDWRPWQVVKKSFSDLINNMQDFVDDMIRFVIVGIPSLIPFLVFVWIIYWAGKKVWGKVKG